MSALVLHASTDSVLIKKTILLATNCMATTHSSLMNIITLLKDETRNT